MKDMGDPTSSIHPSELSTNLASQNNDSNLQRPPDQHQSSNSGLRHSISSSGENVNMPDAYARIQAYKPPAYVSPYGGSANANVSEAGTTSALSTPTPKPRRLSSREEPPWLCCFAQKRIPEWSRHPEIWNAGTVTACTVSVPHPCQHKKCEDCLWESSEETPEEIKSQNEPLLEARDLVIKTDSVGQNDVVERTAATGDLVQEEISNSSNTPGITPSSMLMPKATNWDPKTGRIRLWPKD